MIGEHGKVLPGGTSVEESRWRDGPVERVWDQFQNSTEAVDVLLHCGRHGLERLARHGRRTRK